MLYSASALPTTWSTATVLIETIARLWPSGRRSLNIRRATFWVRKNCARRLIARRRSKLSGVTSRISPRQHRHTGVIDETIQPTQKGVNALHEGFEFADRADILDRDLGVPNLRSQCAQRRRFVYVVEREGEALRGKSARDGAAETTAGAGDQRHGLHGHSRAPDLAGRVQASGAILPAFTQSNSTFFWILPVDVSGYWSTKNQRSGAFCGDRLARQ